MTQLNISTHASLQEAKNSCKELVDEAADRARLRYASKGVMMVAEYIYARDQAQAWTDSGYSGAAPPMVDSWYRASNMPTQQAAAADIITTEALWRSLLEIIRDLRLTGKGNIEAATRIVDVVTIKNNIIQQLDGV